MNGVDCEQQTKWNNADTMVEESSEVTDDVTPNGDCTLGEDLPNHEITSSNDVENAASVTNGTSEHELLEFDDNDKTDNVHCNGIDNSDSVEMLDSSVTSPSNSPSKCTTPAENKVRVSLGNAIHAVNGECSLGLSSSQSSTETITSLKRALDRTNGIIKDSEYKRCKRCETNGVTANGEHAEKLVLTKVGC